MEGFCRWLISRKGCSVLSVFLVFSLGLLNNQQQTIKIRCVTQRKHQSLIFQIVTGLLTPRVAPAEGRLTSPCFMAWTWNTIWIWPPLAPISSGSHCMHFIVSLHSLWTSHNGLWGGILISFYRKGKRFCQGKWCVQRQSLYQVKVKMENTIVSSILTKGFLPPLL
jgi:hypothetical protein